MAYMVYRTGPLPTTLNNPYNRPNPDFKVTPLFDAEYLKKTAKDTTIESNSRGGAPIGAGGVMTPTFQGKGDGGT